MSRIRSIKPEFFKHECLFDAEQESGLPLRLAFAGLWTCCDREGRFEWRPRALKTDILPYDDVDFSRVLDALATRGFVVRYAHGGREYGFVPGFSRHQVVNNRESASILPAPPQDTDSIGNSTRGARVDDASSTRHGSFQGEGEGKGKGKSGGGDAREPPISNPSPPAVPEAPPPLGPTFREHILAACGVDPISGLTGRGGQQIGRSAEMAELKTVMADAAVTEAEALQVISETMVSKRAGRDPGPPGSLNFFHGPIRRFAAARDAPPPPPPPISTIPQRGYHHDKPDQTERLQRIIAAAAEGTSGKDWPSG